MGFDINNIQKIKFIQRLKDIPSFKRCFTKNITKPFINDLKERTNPNIQDNHVVIVCFGETGSWKSGSMKTLAQLFDKQFNVNKITFTNQEMLEALKKDSQKKGGFYIRDEGVKQFGVGSYRLESEIINISETLRQARKSLIFIAPSERTFESCHYILHTLQKDTTKKQVRIGVIDPLTKKYLGYIILPLIWNDQTWKDYTTKKEKFLKDLQSQNLLVNDFDKLAKKIIKDPEFSKYTKQKERLVYLQEKHPNLTTSEKSLLLTKIRIIEKQEQ